MKKIISVVLCLIMVVGVIAACSADKGGQTDDSDSVEKDETVTESLDEVPVSSEEKTEKHIGITVASMTFPYYVRMYEQFNEEAETRGWKITFVDSDLDASKELNALQDMINSDVDALIASTFYLDGLVDVFQQAKDQNIPVVVIGQTAFKEGSPLEDLVSFACGTEHYDAGYLGGKWTSTYLKEKERDSLKMVSMIGTTEQMQARGQGFIDALEDNGISVELLNEYDTSTREEGMRNGEDALTAYPDLELIYGVNAQASLGAYDATVGANRTDVLVVGYDGEDEELETIDKGGNYIATITQAPKAEATVAIEALDKLFAGEELAQIELVPAGIYSSEGQLTSEEVLSR